MAPCISFANSSIDPNKAPVCRSANTTPSRDTTRAVSAKRAWSKPMMYCFKVAVVSGRLAPSVRPVSPPNIPGNSPPPGLNPAASTSSMLSIALAPANNASKFFAESAGVGGTVPMARSRENRRSAFRRKYPNIIEAAYICAACSLDVLISVLLNALLAWGPSMPIKCSLTIPSASTLCAPLVSCVRSTPFRGNAASSIGGNMSTSRVRNF
mmetsp:Transcript_9815/g.36475  ORF Transcript_9815/g.36475 Transcript_9815/m.36475 type:complete len:211 (-) Transcript_9815:709-1341(-)